MRRFGLVVHLFTAFFLLSCESPQESGFEFKFINIEIEGKGKVRNELRGISCSIDCVVKITPSSELTFTAQAKEGYEFLRWEGDCYGDEESCTFADEESKVIKVIFEKKEKAESYDWLKEKYSRH